MLSTLWFLFYLFCVAAVVGSVAGVVNVLICEGDKRVKAVFDLFVGVPMLLLRLYFAYGILSLLGGGA